MEGFTSFFDSQSAARRRWTSESLKNFRQISPAVQNHLKQVYLTLCCAFVAFAFGSYLHVLWNIGGTLTFMGCLGTVLYLLFVPVYKEKTRVSVLLASGVLHGATIGPLIKLAIDINPGILIGACVGCALSFGCFTAAAMLSRRREYLYLGGFLSSGISILLWLQFASFFFGASVSLIKFELYFGLLLFIGYIVVDTQDIIEKAHKGDMDYVTHALTLFTDFVAVFVRVLVIMIQNAQEKGQKEEKKKKSS